MHAVAQSLNEIRGQLSKFFLEREDVIFAMMLGLLAKEHTFILGRPGTAKSQLVRALVRAIIGARYFEVPLSKTKPIEVVLGPLDIAEFRKNSNYRLKRKGYATDVEFLFLDEIGKMSPILGHDLLALLNERVYHEVSDDGTSAHPAPLYSAFTASNEMLTGESDDAAALWDRLLVRVTVDSLHESSNFAKLLRGDLPDPTATVEFEDLTKAIDVEVPSIPIGDLAMEGLVKLRTQFAHEHLYPSDRRWRASVKVLQAAAFLAGRDQIEEEDLYCLRFTLWDTVEEIDKVDRLCAAASNPFVDRLLTARGVLKEIAEGIDSRKAEDVGQRATYGKEANGKLVQVRKDLDDLLDEANGRPIPNFKAVADLHADTLRLNYIVCLDQDPEVADIAVQRKLGKGDGTVKEGQ